MSPASASSTRPLDQINADIRATRNGRDEPRLSAAEEELATRRARKGGRPRKDTTE
ncbi:hypothetical protein [Streptomyces tremellae]|uniref:Uncharacterized protein n=1 Tax=Streptomyces tremellae TaxID=1124239 RepID=A0ABP7EFE3_9ACTN